MDSIPSDVQTTMNQPSTNQTTTTTPTATSSQPTAIPTIRPFINLFGQALKKARPAQKFTIHNAATEVQRIIAIPTKTIQYLEVEEKTKDLVHASLLQLFRQLTDGNVKTENSLSVDISTFVSKWPSTKFHETTLSMVPKTQADFKPCFFVYPKDDTLETSKLNWPKSAEELDIPNAWPQKVLPSNNPSYHLEPTNPPIEYTERMKEGVDKTPKFEVHRFQYRADDSFITGNEYSKNPVGIGHPKGTLNATNTEVNRFDDNDGTTVDQWGQIRLRYYLKSRGMSARGTNEVLKEKIKKDRSRSVGSIHIKNEKKLKSVQLKDDVVSYSSDSDSSDRIASSDSTDSTDSTGSTDSIDRMNSSDSIDQIDSSESSDSCDSSGSTDRINSSDSNDSNSESPLSSSSFTPSSSSSSSSPYKQIDNTTIGGVMLGTRVKSYGYVNHLCENLLSTRQLSTVCPSSKWNFGPTGGKRCGVADARHYLITGWHHGLTRTHIDSGVQVVLYNVMAGRNRFCGLPRDISIRLSSLQR